MKTLQICLVRPLLATLLVLTGCGSVSDIVPQFPRPQSGNSSLLTGQDIARANAFLKAGNRREAANAYFLAAQNYRSPERERLILQAAELAAIIKDPALTQQYLAPLNYDSLSLENQSRFRLIQSQLAMNDRNFREALRILPQRIIGLPDDLGQKILLARMSAAQSSGDKLALVQELVLQEPNLKEAYEVSLNHDRIWNHAQLISSIQLEEAQNKINHPTLKNWLSLARLSRIAKNGSPSSRKSLRSDLARWIQNNPNHPGIKQALGLLNAVPTTTVTPYRVATPKPIAKKPVVVKAAPKKVIPKSITKPAVKAPVKRDPNIRSLYEKIKKEIK